MNKNDNNTSNQTADQSLDRTAHGKNDQLGNANTRRDASGAQQNTRSGRSDLDSSSVDKSASASSGRDSSR